MAKIPPLINYIVVDRSTQKTWRHMSVFDCMEDQCKEIVDEINYRLAEVKAEAKMVAEATNWLDADPQRVEDRLEFVQGCDTFPDEGYDIYKVAPSVIYDKDFDGILNVDSKEFYGVEFAINVIARPDTIYIGVVA